MIAPRLTFRHNERDFTVAQVGEAWAIDVAGGWYFLSAGTDPDRTARRFLRDRMRNVGALELPGFIASERYPLLVTVDGVVVRAWPAFVPRGTGSPTYTNPATGDRVAAVKGPMWMFAARGREAGQSGTVTAEQTVDDVEDLAKVWLRSFE